MDRNELDPSVPSATEVKKIPLIIKVYAVLCILSGVGTLPSVGAFMWQVITALINGNAAAKLGDNTLVAVGLIVAGIMLSAASAVILIIFGLDLIKNQRRNAARLSYILIALTVVELLVDVMLQGIGPFLLRPAIQLGILVALSTTVDPTLRQERELQRRLQEMLDRDAAAEGMLGRDETGEGYIKLNYFNLFWVFFVCCILGLIAEDIWHMTVDDPGVYQNRAGMLFGPFSPIYGFGAVLMTMVLNRFYKKNPIIIFLVSALLGASFEVFVGWFMQTSFGVVSWSYSHMKLFGMPDPLAVLTGGRTCTGFACLWGLGGLIWIKLLLPRLLKLINMIPWKSRYSATVIFTIIMLVDGVMTLQSLDYWYQRVNGTEPDIPVAQFYGKYFDNDFMENRFQSMTMSPKDATRVQHPPRPKRKMPAGITRTGGHFYKRAFYRRKPLRLALDLTHAFILDGANERLQGIDHMRANVPANEHEHDVVTYGKLAACQPHAHIADTRHRARGLDSSLHFLSIEAEHHAAHPASGSYAIGFDPADLGLGRRAHHAVMRQIHPTACRRSIGLGLAQPSINRRHRFAILKHHFSLTVIE